ncbi:Rust resistance-like protein RP1 [Rhynchospora pubera]|uniref:Rust resistance-like protein RP1 n=1 Tax=Rhynchospora pubera TaxID=906938 RepID=A0AAV8DWY5_9POAL|nr:Rust resistance-like protein RP1 [Rhynchospora pubera]
MALVETIGVKGLGWVASPIVSRLISHGFSYVGMDVPKELSELETILLPKISLFIKSLPRSSTNNIPELKPWLQRLQDAYYEAEDLLDEAST